MFTTRWCRWCQRGLWARLRARLAGQASGTLRFVDASHIKVHDASNLLPALGRELYYNAPSHAVALVHATRMQPAFL